MGYKSIYTHRLFFLAINHVKVDKAESRSTQNGNHHPRPSHRSGGGQNEEDILIPAGGGGIEPRVAKLEEGDNSDGAVAGTPCHPSSAVARDSYARAPSTNSLGRDAAACLLQSRYRGYRLRKYGGGVSLRGGMPGRDSSDGQEERARGATPFCSEAGRAMDGKCSVLDLEV